MLFLDHSLWLVECNNLIDLGLAHILYSRANGWLVSLLDVMSWEGGMNLCIKIKEVERAVPEEELTGTWEGLVNKPNSALLYSG